VLAGVDRGKLGKESRGEKEDSLVNNNPKGISIQSLIYPPSRAEILLVGVKRKTVIHSSFVYGKIFDSYT